MEKITDVPQLTREGCPRGDWNVSTRGFAKNDRTIMGSITGFLALLSHWFRSLRSTKRITMEAPSCCRSLWQATKSFGNTSYTPSWCRTSFTQDWRVMSSSSSAWPYTPCMFRVHFLQWTSMSSGRIIRAVATHSTCTVALCWQDRPFVHLRVPLYLPRFTVDQK